MVLKEMEKCDLILINNAYYMKHSDFSGSNYVPTKYVACFSSSSSRCAEAFSLDQDQHQVQLSMLIQQEAIRNLPERTKRWDHSEETDRNQVSKFASQKD